MTELTRRQMRELERTGQAPQPSPAGSASELQVISVGVQEPKPPSLIVSEQPLTRRQLREQQLPSFEQTSSLTRASALTKTLAAAIETPAKQEAPAVVPPQRVGLGPLPPVGLSRRASRVSAANPAQEVIQSIQPLEVEIPEDGLRGANYLGEPSTQSIVLDVAPEAMSISVDTGEIFTTGSIAILPDTTGSITGNLDGIDLDGEEAVTGVISIVDPVSARDLIDERSPLGVVPSSILRKGWWRPWVVGALSVLMALTAIFASITIFNALGD